MKLSNPKIDSSGPSGATILILETFKDKINKYNSVKTNKIGFYSIILAIIIAISVGVPLYLRDKRTFYPPITINSYQLNPNMGEEWELNITTGYVPDPCWELKNPKININEKDFSINIGIFVRHNTRGGCILSVVTYDVQIILIFPSIGNWTVSCNNQIITICVV